jgi:hypothetical protein
MSITTDHTAIAVLQPDKRRPIMQFNSNINEEGTHITNFRNPLLRRAIQAAVATGLVAMLAGSVPRGVTAQDDGHGPACSNATLRGDYGFLVGGIRGAGPGLTESFVGTALRTYDGHGNFTHIDSSHGQLSGAARDREASGTYEVNANCTGTATMIVPGVPFPIETSFVIVDRGRQVNEAVMSPQPNLVTAIAHRK